MPAKLSIVFAGTPAFAVPALEAIAATRHLVRAVFTQPDRRAGRGLRIEPSPVKRAALAHSLPVEQPATFRDADSVALLAGYEPDVLVVVAYGLLLPQAALDIPRLGCLGQRRVDLRGQRSRACVHRQYVVRQGRPPGELQLATVRVEPFDFRAYQTDPAMTA